MTKNLQLKIISGILFCVLFGFGLLAAQQKPLWNDELYTQIHSVEKLSPLRMLQAKVPEGNNSPLFYVLQKLITGVVQYRFPFEWTGEWQMTDLRSQIILRLQPNLFMALAITAMFYFFARYYSIKAGIYAVLLNLCSLTVWTYWLEARPYSLWFFLTTVQSLLLLAYFNDRPDKSRILKGLMIVHVLLALTMVFGAVQIVVASFLIWMLDRKILRFYLGLTLVTLFIGPFYYAAAPKYNFFFPPWLPERLILHNFHPEWMIVILAALISQIIYKRRIANDEKKFLMWLGITVFVAAALLIYFKVHKTSTLNAFEVSVRYFMFLTPVAVIASSLFVFHAFRLFEGRWLQINFGILLAGLLVWRFLKTYITMTGLQ